MVQNAFYFFQYVRIPEQFLQSSRSNLELLNNNHYLLLDEFVMDVKGFYPFVGELVRNVFKFKRRYVETSQEIFNRMNVNNQHIMVSIHIRLTDMDRHLRENWSIRNEPDRYLENAMNYFHETYKAGIMFLMS